MSWTYRNNRPQLNFFSFPYEEENGGIQMEEEDRGENYQIKQDENAEDYQSEEQENGRETQREQQEERREIQRQQQQNGGKIQVEQSEQETKKIYVEQQEQEIEYSEEEKELIKLVKTIFKPKKENDTEEKDDIEEKNDTEEKKAPKKKIHLAIAQQNLKLSKDDQLNANTMKQSIFQILRMYSEKFFPIEAVKLVNENFIEGRRSRDVVDVMIFIKRIKHTDQFFVFLKKKYNFYRSKRMPQAYYLKIFFECFSGIPLMYEKPEKKNLQKKEKSGTSLTKISQYYCGDVQMQLNQICQNQVESQKQLYEVKFQVSETMKILKQLVEQQQRQQQ